MQLTPTLTTDSVSECTRTLQDAIDQVHAADGGTVTIPPGIWEIASIHLRSGVTLDLPAAATLRASADLSHYPQSTAQDANKDRQPFHLIIAENCEQITLSGDGKIDGNGRAFWHPSMREIAAGGMDVDAYCDAHQLPAVYRNPQHPWYREHDQRVSPMLELKNCRHIRLRGITFANSPGWTVHCHDCDDLHIHGITIANDLYGPNTDGLDLNGCRDVRISDCDLTCGDDAIILKSMADARACERVVVSNCIISTHCAALGLGAEVVHAIRDVVFSNCVIRQALRAFQIEMWDAGLIENVLVSNITGVCHTEIPLQRALYIDIQHHKRGPDSPLGRCRNIQLCHISLRTRGRCVFTAAEGSVIENLLLRDVHLIFDAVEDPAATVPAYPSNQMSNDCPEARIARAAVVAQNCHRLQLQNVITTWPGEGSNAPALLPDNPLNPHIGFVPMARLWTQGCEALVDESPMLTDFPGC